MSLVDKKMIKKKLRKIGRFLPKKLVLHLDYLRSYKKILNLKNPKYFGEKIQWMKLYGNLERYSKFVDKYKVRDFIKKTIGDRYLNELYGVYDNPKDIDFNKLPQKFVLKVNNGSGGNIICKNKNNLNRKKVIKILNKWMNNEYYKYSKEMQYKNIKSKVICEKYLEDETGSLRDYKFNCANGEIMMIEIHSDRNTDHKENYYDLNWNDYGIICKRKKIPYIEKPANLDEMIDVAKKLSKDFPYVRVDLYSVKNQIYFGELTFTPANGTDPIYPLEKDQQLAKNIQIHKFSK